MHETMRRNHCGELIFYTNTRLAGVRHGFTTKAGGVSTGDCESLNLGFNRGDAPENVRENYRILANALHVPAERLTMTQQVHGAEVTVVTEDTVGIGMARPLSWETDALVTNLPDTPLIGYYADCVVTLLYDPQTHTCGVCHAGWRGTAANILGKTVDTMVRALGTQRETLVAVLGPSICGDCFETDADVPEAMLAEMGALVRPFIQPRGVKFHVDLRSVNAMLLREAGLCPGNIIDSGICTRCESQTFWSHRATNGKRGVQGAVICL